jgi:hypothetical protein
MRSFRLLAAGAAALALFMSSRQSGGAPGPTSVSAEPTAEPTAWLDQIAESQCGSTCLRERG